MRLIMNKYAVELWWIAVFLFGITVLVLSGCCSWATGHCPKPAPVPQLVEVPVPCKLPPPIELPEVVPLPVGEACPLPLTCFDVEGAKGIANRESAMKTWIKEAKAACK